MSTVNVRRIGAAFAVLIAFGSGGPSVAAIIGVTFVISNGIIQSAVSSWVFGSALRVHPVVVLAMMIGGTVAGIVGMVLAPPLVAAAIKSVEVVKERRATSSAEPSAPDTEWTQSLPGGT